MYVILVTSLLPSIYISPPPFLSLLFLAPSLPQGLSYLQCSSQLPSSDSQSLKYVDDLTNQFSAPDITNEDISQWIEVGGVKISEKSRNNIDSAVIIIQTNCPPPVRSTPEFVATVTTAIVNATVTGTYMYMYMN